ncbi:response regulator [Nocardioides sp. GCM10027113]|uniref:response regulator n=1 Tax=unclassified Nocardioides TaxID=2615069 RepID=UPI00361FCD09
MDTEPDGFYRDIVESSSDGIWVFDLSGRTLFANRTLADMFGVDRSEFCRLTVFDSLDDVGREQFREHLEDLRAGRFNNVDAECKFVRRDGSHLWVLVSERPLLAPDGSVRAVLHRLADYDDRRRILDELRTHRRQLAEAQSIARIGSWEWDVEQDLITVSDGLLDIYGLDRESFPAHYAQFLGTVHEEDRQRVHEAVQGALVEGDSFVFEARLQGAEDWIWTRGRGVVHRDVRGTVVSMSGTHQDISESKLADLALQDQIAQNALMRAVASAANEARTLDEVLGQARSLVLLHDDWERARAFLASEDGRSVRRLPVAAADGIEAADPWADPDRDERELALATRSLQANASVWDEDRLTIAFPVRHRGRVHAVLTITSAPPLYRHDMIQAMVEQVAVQIERVVEREQAERALAAARDSAMEASRQKSEFLATMSHEIRTPLNGVIGLNDLLLRTNLDPDQQRLASGVQAAGRSLLGLINDILDFSKIEAGKLELEQVDFTVRDVFDQVADVLGASAREKGLDLVVACGVDVPEVLRGDPTRLAQVVTNLVSNAVKFTTAGEVVVTVGASAHAARNTLRVDVTDTGIGIEAEELDHLFDSFTQADASTTRVHGGTGLGLAISREIVRAFGGDIGAHSTPGKGSRFWFTALLDHPGGGAQSPADVRARAVLAEKRALVVATEVRTQELMLAQLSRWDMTCEVQASAETAAQAVAAARRDGDPFDVAVVDRNLAGPPSSGLSLAKSLSEDPANAGLPIVLLSATPDLDTPTVHDYGVDDFLVKPVTSHALRTTLVDHLGGGDPALVDAPAEAGTGPRPRVLVVEDNPVNQMVAVGLLEALGYAPDTADDGVIALEKVAHQVYDAVLMDVQMPRLDGYAATRALREREQGRRVPVLAMTAAAIEGERERCLEAGMDDFLTKPVDPEALRSALERLVGPRQAAATEPVTAADVPANGTGAAAAPTAELDLARLDMLRDIAPGDTTYLDRAIANFVGNAPGALATIRSAVRAHDVGALRHAAHRLAGSATNIGVVSVGEAARGLEEVADAGTTDGTEELLAALDRTLAEGTAALLAYQASYRGAEAV